MSGPGRDHGASSPTALNRAQYSSSSSTVRVVWTAMVASPHFMGSPRPAGPPAPRRPAARLSSSRSPRPAGPQPRDGLRLAQRILAEHAALLAVEQRRVDWEPNAEPEPDQGDSDDDPRQPQRDQRGVVEELPAPERGLEIDPADEAPEQDGERGGRAREDQAIPDGATRNVVFEKDEVVVPEAPRICADSSDGRRRWRYPIPGTPAAARPSTARARTEPAMTTCSARRSRGAAGTGSSGVAMVFVTGSASNAPGACPGSWRRFYRTGRADGNPMPAVRE